MTLTSDTFAIDGGESACAMCAACYLRMALIQAHLYLRSDSCVNDIPHLPCLVACGMIGCDFSTAIQEHSHAQPMMVVPLFTSHWQEDRRHHLYCAHARSDTQSRRFDGRTLERQSSML